jgi:hypothetical protein
MSDVLTFDGSHLRWGGESWSAVSGPHGKGRLPAGWYTVEVDRRTAQMRSGQLGDGYHDRETGLEWFVPLTPDQSIGRTGLGIHPDGNVPGTLGCVGITHNADSFYRALRLAGHLRLHVEYTH